MRQLRLGDTGDGERLRISHHPERQVQDVDADGTDKLPLLGPAKVAYLVPDLPVAVEQLIRGQARLEFGQVVGQDDHHRQFMLLVRSQVAELGRLPASAPDVRERHAA